MLVLGVAGLLLGTLALDFSLWLIIPSVVLVLLGLMPFDAARRHMLEQTWAQRELEQRQRSNESKQ